MTTILHVANTRTLCADLAYVLHFGAWGDTRVLAFARSLDDALDECVDWIADNAPGLLCDEEVAAEYRRIEAEWREEHPGKEPSDRQIEAWQDEAEADATCAGNRGHYLHSWEWGYAISDASPEELGSYVSELRARMRACGRIQ